VAGYTKMVYPQTVTHRSINRARRKVTPLIETNALPLSQVDRHAVRMNSATFCDLWFTNSPPDRRTSTLDVQETDHFRSPMWADQLPSVQSSSL